MSRYIDADKLFLHFNDWALAMSPDERHSDVPEYSQHKIHEMIYRTINEAMTAIENQPTADVRENVHGEWVRTERSDCIYECSRCGNKIFSAHKEDRLEYHSWCGRCGADMRKGETNG